MKALLLLLVLCASLAAAPAGFRLPVSSANISAPTNISGVVTWVDGSQLALAHDDPVSLWTDLSGNSRDLSQPNASFQPVFKTNVLNGKSAVLFSTNYLTNAFAYSAGAKTIFAVARLDTASGYKRIASSVPDANFYVGAVAANVATFMGTNGAWNDVSANSPSISISGAWRVVEVKTDNTTLSPKVNSTGQTTKNGLNGTSTGVAVGGLFNGTGQGWTGHIAEIVFFDRMLSEIESSQVRGYLNNKWSVY